jgi:hypothetical protein
MAVNIQQIMQVTSESLQKKIRDLLPSQQGFGVDLQASNVIVPIVDLTAAAEGSQVPESLQNALAFGSQTAFNLNTSGTISSTTGFLRIVGTGSCTHDTLITQAKLQMTDSLTTKTIWGLEIPVRNSGSVTAVGFDLIVFVASGVSVTGLIQNKANLTGSVRQIADVNGNLVNPSGFNPQ